MAGIKRFEEIEAWKEARELTREIYRATKQAGFCRDFGLRDQDPWIYPVPPLPPSGK